MKKFTVPIAVLSAALFAAGCASSPERPSADAGPPEPAGPSADELMSGARNSAPAGTLVGQATAKEESKEASETKAEQNARYQLVMGMSFITEELINAQVASGRLPDSVSEDFRRNAVNALSMSALGSAEKLDSGFGADDTAWCVYYMLKGDTLKEINRAVSAAKQTVAAGNFNTNDFDAIFDDAAAMEWKN